MQKKKEKQHPSQLIYLFFHLLLYLRTNNAPSMNMNRLITARTIIITIKVPLWGKNLKQRQWTQSSSLSTSSFGTTNCTLGEVGTVLVFIIEGLSASTGVSS